MGFIVAVLCSAGSVDLSEFGVEVAGVETVVDYLYRTTGMETTVIETALAGLKKVHLPGCDLFDAPKIKFSFPLLCLDPPRSYSSVSLAYSVPRTLCPVGITASYVTFRLSLLQLILQLYHHQHPSVT